MNKVRTCLIQPNICHNALGTVSPWDSPSLGLAYIASILRISNHDVKIIDAYIDQLSILQLINQLNQYNPQIIGITANGYSAKNAILTARFIKKKRPNSLIVFGGPFATAEYTQILQDKLCDICVIGEGEITFRNIVQAIEEQKPWNKLKGTAFFSKSENRVIVNEPQDFLDELDEIPFPAWDLFPPIKKYKNLRGIVKTPFLPIITSRGCPFHCNWCSKNIHGYRFRPRSPENVVNEIVDDVKKYGIKEIAIMDDVFTLDRKRVKKICVLLLKRKVNIILNFYSGIRADMLDDSVLKFLYAVGVNRITIGVESGNQKVLDQVGKGLKLSSVLNAVQLAKKYRLIIDGFFILGHPFDTKKTMEETIEFSKKVDFSHAYFFTAIPFPGTQLFNIVKDQGCFLYDFTHGSSYHIVEGRPAFEMPQLFAKDVTEAYNKSYLNFYLRPKKISQLFFIYIRLIFYYRSSQQIKWLFSQFMYIISLFVKKIKKV